MSKWRASCTKDVLDCLARESGRMKIVWNKAMMSHLFVLDAFCHINYMEMR